MGISAERLLTEKWLATQPEAVILALAQLTRQAQDENVRVFQVMWEGPNSAFRCALLLRSSCEGSFSDLRFLIHIE